MKKIRLSLSGIFRLIGAGAVITALVLSIGIFCATQDMTAVMGCLITAGVLSVWAAVLIRMLQYRLVLLRTKCAGLLTI